MHQNARFYIPSGDFTEHTWLLKMARWVIHRGEVGSSSCTTHHYTTYAWNDDQMEGWPSVTLSDGFQTCFSRELIWRCLKMFEACGVTGNVHMKLSSFQGNKGSKLAINFSIGSSQSGNRKASKIKQPWCRCFVPLCYILPTIIFVDLSLFCGYAICFLLKWQP